VKPIRIFINGFGRIGRSAARIILDDPALELVGINDLYGAEQMAYLLRFDSVYGPLGREVEAGEGALFIDGNRVAVFTEPDPHRLDLYGLEVDVLIQSSGHFLTIASNEPYRVAGAKRVVVSTPPQDGMPVYIRGVNDTDYAGEPIVSNSSCSANAIVPLFKALEAVTPIRGAHLHMYHSYTAYQNLLDGPHYGRDIRRTRAAAANIIPIDSSAAGATAHFFPRLAGNLYAKSIRIPVPAVTLYDLLITLEGRHDPAQLQRALLDEIDRHWQGILAHTGEPKVSSDYIADPYSATIDRPLMDLSGGRLLRISAWQDNEYGYAVRLVEMAKKVAQNPIA